MAKIYYVSVRLCSQLVRLFSALPGSKKPRFLIVFFAFAAISLFAVFPAIAEYYRGDMNGWGTTAMSSSSWGSRWEVTIQSDGDNSTSSMKFTQNADWVTQWGLGSTVAKNSTVGTLAQNGGNLSFSSESDTKYYTFRMNSDHGKYCVSETSGTVTDFSSVSHNYNPPNSLEGPVTVTIELDSSKNSEEEIWLRYTTDGFTSDHFVKATGSSTNYSASIPALGDGTDVEFYVLSSTFPSNVVDGTDVDLVTLRGENNGGANYSYTVFAPKHKWYTTSQNPTTTALGSTNLQIYFDTYQKAGGTQNRSWASIFIKAGNSNLTSGTTEGVGRDPGASADATYANTHQFTSIGTWYYAMRVSYGTDTNYWVGSSNSAWTVMGVTAPTSSTLSITVTNLPESTGVSAVTNTANPDTAVDLAWTRPGTYNVMIVRRQGANPDLPTDGTLYSHNDTYGPSSRNTVIYAAGSGSSDTDSGLTANTEYYYGFFTENYSYYSPGYFASTTTASDASADLGNCWHIPTNSEPPSVTMRNPTTDPSTNQGVYFYNGNQFQGGGNVGDQSGGTLYHRLEGPGGSWSSTNMAYDSLDGNNKYWVTSIPAGAYEGTNIVEYYVKVTYSDHDDTYIGTTNSGAGSLTYATAGEVQTNAFTFTYSGETEPSAAYMWHSDNRTVSGTNVECWVKIGYAEGIGSNKWVDYASIYYTTNGTTPYGGYGLASNAATKVQTMSFDHMEDDDYPDGNAMWWAGTMTNLPEQVTIKYKIGSWKSASSVERYADYNTSGTDNDTFSFSLGVDTNGPVLTVGSLNADYTTTKFFIDEIAGETQEVVVTFTPNSPDLSKVEIFSNLDRRDYVDVDFTNQYITGDGYADGINPPEGNLISTNDTNAYFVAYTMISQGGGDYVWTGRVSHCGAYRLTARYQTNGMAATNWHWYTDSGAGRRDHAIVVSPEKVHQLTMYELNTLTVEAEDNTESGRSTFVDLLGADNGDGDGYDHFNLDYLNFIQANCLWFQPIHPSGEERSDEYTPGSPYASRDYFAVTPYMGSNNTAAGAMAEFTNFVVECDAYTGSVGTVNVMLDGVFNHTSWDAEMGQGGVDKGFTGTATDRMGALRPSWYSLNTDYGLPATSYVTSTNNNFATAPDRGDFGKWDDVTELYYGKYSALVRHNPENNGDYLNENDVYDFSGMTTNQMDLWKYFGYYAEFWLDKTGHGGVNTFVQANDDKGIDGLRCDFGQGLPPQAWEYIINHARKIKWNLIFMAETLDGGVPAYRSNRHFDVLNENLVFQFTQSHINDSSEVWSALEDRRNSYNGGAILLNLTSHDEVLPDNDTWLTASRYGAVSSVDGIPMIFYGQEQGIQNYNSDPSYWHYDGFKTAHEENFGKYVPHFKQWNQLTVWTSAPPSSTGLAQWYGRVNWARLNSVALQSKNRYFLSKNGGGDEAKILAVAKYETANASPATSDVVLAFSLLLRHGEAHAAANATYNLQPVWSLIGGDTNKTYNVRNLASSDASAYLWATNKTGVDLYDNGIYVNLLADTAGNNMTNDGALVQYLKLDEFEVPVATGLVVNGGADVTDAQVTGGTYSVVMHLYSEDGISTSSVSPLFQPNFDILDVTGTEILTDKVFSAFSYLGTGETLLASNNNHSAIYPCNGLGTYTSRWSAVSSNNAETINSTTLSNGTAMTFTVVDDDTNGPTAQDFVIWGGSGISTVTVSELFSGNGWAVTGLVGDADSGINTNGTTVTHPDSTPYFILLDSSGTPRLTNAFNTTFGDGGATSLSAVSNAALSSVSGASSGTWTARVVVADNDEDRGNSDHAFSTNDFAFEVTGGTTPLAKDRTATNNATSVTLGDTNIILGADTETAFGGSDRTNVQIRIKYGSTNLTSGYTAGGNRDPGTASVDAFAFSPQFTQTGTWYWAMDVTFGATNFFYTTNSSGYVSMSVQPTNSALQITVTNIPNATGLSFSDVGTTNLTVNWTAAGYQVMVVRRLGANPDAPTDGTAYTHNETYGTDNRNQVIYAAGGGSSDVDVGLTAQSEYHYAVFSENYSYYSPGTFGSVTTLTASVDGNDDEWVGTLPGAVNSSTISSNEFIWLDKQYERETDSGSAPDTDMLNFHIRADETDVFFMCRFDDITDVGYPYLAISIDTDRSSSDTAMDWIADDSETGFGDGYYTNGNAAMHYPERNIIVHTVPAVGQRIELYADDGSSWYAPPTYGNDQVNFNATDNFIELKIARSDLGLTGSVTARFTVASYFNNTGIGDNQWANDGDTTADYGGTDAQDSLSVVPYGTDDAAGSLNTYDEETSDNDIDCYFDVKFDANGLAGNTLPTTPDITGTDTKVVFPTNNATVETGTLGFNWPDATDADDEVTGYLLEVSTNSTIKGENGSIDHRSNAKHTESYKTISSGFGGTQYYWRVRSRDLGGMLSGHTTNRFVVSGSDDDTTGPTPTLLYVGTTYSVGATQTNITDADLANTNDLVDIAVKWTDPSGVFMTNYTTNVQVNILSNLGRVIPNWDLYSSNQVTHTTQEFGFDEVFTSFYGSNGDLSVTTVYNNAFSVTNVDFDNLLYLTVSGEDEDNDRGTYPDSQGDGDPIPHDRMVTTNDLVRFYVIDDDTNAPTMSDVVISGNSRGDGTVLGLEMVSGSWSITGLVKDVYSGVKVNGSSTTQPTNSPYLVIYDPDGATRLTEVFDTFSFGDGGATNDQPLANMTPGGISGQIQSGVWTAMVVVTDSDADRDNDHTTSSNYYTFNVPTFEWDAGGGADRDWTNDLNWTVDTPPTVVDVAHINGGYTAVVSQAGPVALDLYVGDNGVGGTDAGTGTVEQTGSVLSFGGILALGENVDDLGIYTISAGTLNIGSTTMVGIAGMGLMTVTGTAAVVASNDFIVGHGSVSGIEDFGSTLTMAGGTLDVETSLEVGYTAGADGTINLTGGTLSVTDLVVVGSASAATGLLEVTGGVLNAGGAANWEHFIVGSNGYGRVTISGASTVNVANAKDLVVGGEAGNNASNTVSVSGGELNVDDNIEIGNANGAVGYLHVSGGAVNIADELLIGNASGSTGTVTIVGGVVTNGVNENITVGYGGDGSLTVSGTGLLRTSGSGDIRIGSQAGSTGALSVAGGTLAVANRVYVGEGDSGTMTVSSGDVTVGSQLTVGVSSYGSLTIDGGAVTVQVFKVADNTGSSGSVFNMNAGSLVVTDTGANSFLVDYPATLNIAGGTIDADEYNLSRSGSGTVSINLSGGTIGGDNNFNVGAGAGESAEVYQTGGTLDLNGASGELRIGYDVDNTFGYYTITGGVINIEDNFFLGRATGTGTGVFHVIGVEPSITIGTGTTGDFNMEGDNARLQMTFVSSLVSTIQVADVITLDGTLTVSNQGAITAGEYLILTSSTDVVTGTFDSTNWAGGTAGTVIYGSDYVSLFFSSEIAVLGTNISLVITNSDITPTTADGTDFGTLIIGTATNDNTFVVTNMDQTYDLSLSGSPRVDLTGAHPDKFSVQSQPAATIGPEQSSPFTVRFAPTTVGSYTATVSIANNDITGDENPYTFSIVGIGTLAAEPTVHASDMLFADITNVSMTVSWVNGNGANRILVAKADNPVAGTPADGTPYTANSAFGSGNTIAAGEFVVYNGSGTSVTVTALSPGTTYHFTVFEYNGSSISINYYTGGTPLSGSQATLTYAPIITEGISTSVTMSENGDPTAFSLTLNATDEDPGDTLTWSINSAPFSGTASASGTGTSKAISYTPPDYFSGSDSFVVKVTDSYGSTDVITVQVTVEAVNLPGKVIYIFE